MGETFVEWQLAFKWGTNEKSSNYNCNHHVHVIDAPTQAYAHAYESTEDTRSTNGACTHNIVISHVWEHGMSDFLQWYIHALAVDIKLLFSFLMTQEMRL